MPTIIPRVQGPSVQVQRIPNARNTAQVDLSPVAQGAQRLGAIANDYLQREIAQHDTARLMEARAELSNWYSRVKDPNNEGGILAYQGEKALQLSDRMLPDLDKQITTIGTRLTPQQRQQFDRIATEFRSRVRDDFTDYMSGQAQAMLTQKNAAMNQALTSEAVRAGLDGKYVDQEATLTEMLAANQRMGQLKGLPAEVIAQGDKALASAVYRQTIVGQLTRDPALAQRYFESVDDKMTAADLIAVEDVIYPTLIADRARTNARAFLDGGAIAGDGYNGPGDGQAAPVVSAPIRTLIESAADKYSVPRHIALAMAQQESGFNPKAVGPDTRWGKAKGLFQYLDGTAAGLGIDPLNPAQAADAAMKQLAEQAKDRGWDWAIAHHHAGPNLAEHGPKTRRYVSEVQAKARRFGGGTVAGIVPRAVSVDDAMARAEAITDPRERQQTLQEMRTIIAGRKAAAEVEEQQRGDAIYAKATSGDSLTPNELHFLAINPKYKEAIERYRELSASGRLVKDDAVLLDQLQRMQVSDPDGFGRLPLAQYADRLSGSTMLGLSKAQKEAANPEKRTEWATQESLLRMAYADLGIGGEGKAADRVEFEKAFTEQKRALMQRSSGRKPTSDELQQIINRLKLPMAKSGLFGTSTREVYRANPEDGFDVPKQSRDEIVAEFRRQGVSSPTPAQIRQVYLTQDAGDRL